MSNYLYNGLEAPVLPVVDSKYPHLLIVDNGGVTTLLACKTAPYAGRANDGQVVLDSDSTVSYTPYELAEDGSAWEAVGKEYYFGGRLGGRGVPIIWVNFDLLNEDGSVYLAASDPIPVAEPTEPFALLMGFRVGQMIKGMRGKITEQPDSGETEEPEEPEQTPVAYLYNGVRLPKLPEWDKEAYPYAVIVYVAMSQSYWLRVFKQPYTTSGTGTLAYFLMGTGDTYLQWSLPKKDIETDTGWGEPSEKETSNTVVANDTKWSNYDIYTDDGTLRLAVSEPVPVYE